MIDEIKYGEWPPLSSLMIDDSERLLKLKTNYSRVYYRSFHVHGAITHKINKE